MSWTDAGERTRSAPRPPGLLRLGFARGTVELKEFFRDKQAWIFTFAFPVLLLLVFSTALGNTFPDDVNAAQYFLPVMMAFGIMSTCFLNLGIGVAVDRDDGTLKRLRGTPMPPASYFIGKFVFVAVTAVAEIALQLVLAVAVLGVELPGAPARWGTFAWVVVLGACCFCLLGLAVSSLAWSGRNAGAVINLPFLVLQFVSGVFIPLSQLPGWLRDVSAVFPVRWFAQGLLSVFTGTDYSPWIPVVLGCWTIAGLVLCTTTFRWTGRRDG